MRAHPKPTKRDRPSSAPRPRGPRDLPQKDAAPRLTCCLIARDEADMLPACLTSLRNVADEVIVVDTGSTDDTVQIAQAHGAKVLAQPWRDDFSAPRNLAVAHARGDWVLLLDADERISRASQPALRAVLSGADFDCGLIPLHNAAHLEASEEDVVSGRARLEEPHALPRLFLNTDNLRWEGFIHERPTSWLLRNTRMRTLDQLAIVHYGAVPSLREGRNKALRNLRIMEKHCQQLPEDARIRTYLAYALSELGDHGRAAAEIARAFTDLQREAATTSRLKPNLVAAAALHASYLRAERRLEDAANVLHEALRGSKGSQDEAHPTLLFQLAITLELRALTASEAAAPRYLERARAALTACLAQAGKVFAATVNPPGCTGELALRRLGTIALIRGDLAAAHETFASLLEISPSDMEGQLGLAEALLLDGDTSAFDAMISPLLTDQAPDAYTLAASAAARAGDRRRAQHLATQALQQLKHSPFVAPHRRELLRNTCQRLRAAL